MKPPFRLLTLHPTSISILTFVLLSLTGNAQVQIPPSGYINTVAGSGLYGHSGDGGPATNATFYGVSGVAVDSAGNIYISDTENGRIRKVTASTGIISTATFPNGGHGCPYTGALLSNMQLTNPTGLNFDRAGNLYITEADCDMVAKVNASSGLVTVVAGNGYAGYNGDGILATSARLYTPNDVAVDSAGNIYIADTANQRIRKVTVSTGIISTVAGTGTSGYNGDGGAATSAEIWAPRGVCVDGSGNIYIADSGNNRVRKIAASTGVISTIAGDGTAGYSGDGGAATSAELSFPAAIRIDAVGSVYVGDENNQRIRKIAASTGAISTIAGNGVVGFAGDGGLATNAELDLGPGYIGDVTLAFDGAGNLYIGDDNNNRIRVVGH